MVLITTYLHTSLPVLLSNVGSLTPAMGKSLSGGRLYMGKNDLGTLPLCSVRTWTLWIFHTQKVTLIFSLKSDT